MVPADYSDDDDTHNGTLKFDSKISKIGILNNPVISQHILAEVKFS